MGRPKLTPEQKVLSDRRKNERLRLWQKDWREKFPEKKLRRWAQKRAKEKGLEFNIEAEDVIIPDKCPLLGIPLRTDIKKGEPRTNIATIDRIDNKKGYVKGNIQVISHLANTMKSNATPEQLILFAKNILESFGHRCGGTT